ncbi:MAG: YciI family protein [Caulobacteraceae bacterium]
MLYLVTARFKPDVEDQHAALAPAFNDHMAQPLLRIRMVGALVDGTGRREGVLLMMEADGRAEVDHFLADSPYARAGLYRSVDIDVLQIEAGGLK